MPECGCGRDAKACGELDSWATQPPLGVLVVSLCVSGPFSDHIYIYILCIEEGREREPLDIV